MVLLSLCTLSPIVTVANVSAKPRYVPPKTIGTPNRTLGGGSRGCGGFQSPRDLHSLTPQFQLLVPHDHIGVTVSTHPTLTWQMGDVSPVPMELALVEPGVSQPLWVTTIFKTQVGINQIKVPRTVQALEPGRLYRWTLSQICNPKRPSENAYATAWIERTESTAHRGMALGSDEVQAHQLAEAGIWYDALAYLTKDMGGSLQGSDSVKALLEDIGLSTEN